MSHIVRDVKVKLATKTLNQEIPNQSPLTKQCYP